MRIQIVGDSVCARALRGNLVKAGYALVEHFPQYRVVITEADVPAIEFDSVDCDLERWAKWYVTGRSSEHGGLGRITIQQAGGNQSDRELHITVPIHNPVEQEAVEVGVMRAFLKVTGDPRGQRWWLLWALLCALSAAPVGAQGVRGTVGGSAVAQGSGGASAWLVKFDPANNAITFASPQHIICDSGCGAPPVFGDGSAFTIGTSTIVNIGGVFKDGASALADGVAAAFRITASRAVHANLRDASGNELASATSAPAGSERGLITRNVPSGTQAVSGSVTSNAGTNLNTSSLAIESGGNLATLVTNATGLASAGNTSTATLGSSATFTGTFENVKNYAFLSLSVFSDQASANDGLMFDWSHDGSNIDVTESSSVLASTGRGFALVPRAQYFRVRYVNGTTAQGTFRVGTVYHPSGTGLISKPLDATVTTENFAETTRAAVIGKDESGTGFSNIASATALPIVSDVGLVVRNVPDGTQVVRQAYVVPWALRCNAVRRTNCS